MAPVRIGLPQNLHFGTADVSCVVVGAARSGTFWIIIVGGGGGGSGAGSFGDMHKMKPVTAMIPPRSSKMLARSEIAQPSGINHLDISSRNKFDMLVILNPRKNNMNPA